MSRSGESDNVYLRDEESVTENGLTEIKIVDNQIMNFNNRSDFLQGILDALDGLYYYINDFNSTGILYYEVGDLYNVQIGENTYQCIMLNDEIDVTTGIEEIVYTEMPEQSETDYEKADKTDRRINQTYLIVDKQNQRIDSVISNVSEQNNKISQITQTVDELNSKIQDIADITTYGESDSAYVELTDINQSEPIMIKVHPTSTNISYLYPRENLYPSDLQFLPDRIIRFTRTYEEDGETLTENIDYTLPDDLLRYNSNVYDEFYLDYDSHTCQVIKRCQYNVDGTVSQLANEITTDYPYPQILLGDGDYEISLHGYDYGYIYVRLMAQNIYTTQFATKAEVTSEISQTAQEIDLNVNQKLTNYSTTTEMNSAITVKANEINSTVSQKVGKNEVISSINQSAEAVTINANKVNLAGKTINLTGDNIKIASNNFNVDKNGNMTCNSANITGGKFNVTASTANTDTLKITSSSNSNDYMYASPAMVYLNGSKGKAELIAKSVASDHSYLILSSGSGVDENLRLTEKGINCQNIYDNVTTSNVPNMQIGSNGDIRRSTNTSTKKHKKDIKEVENIELNPKRLYKLPIKQFKYKNKYQPKKEDFRYNKDLIGFIAEDVAEIYPIATDYDENGAVENWNERYIIPAMLKLIQEQHIEIEQMKKEIEKLKGGI